ALRTRHDVRNERQRIRGARVFGFRRGLEIQLARRFVDYDVLEHGAESMRGGPNFGLGFLRELDDLRVTAALEIEYPVGGPAVLVVADEGTSRIGGKRRLAGAREAEEDGDVAGFAHVRAAVHRQRIPQRQDVIHNGEDRLLDLTGVTRA